MANLTDRAAYLRGLAEGMGLDKEKNEHKLLLEMLGLMDEMAQKVADLDADVGELEEYVEDLDSDLSDMGEVLFGDDDDECDCDECGAEDFEDGDIYEVCCPTCGDIVCIDSVMLEEGQTTCPNCGELLEFDLEDDGEETEDSDNEDK